MQYNLLVQHGEHTADVWDWANSNKSSQFISNNMPLPALRSKLLFMMFSILIIKIYLKGTFWSKLRKNISLSFEISHLKMCHPEGLNRILKIEVIKPASVGFTHYSHLINVSKFYYLNKTEQHPNCPRIFQSFFMMHSCLDRICCCPVAKSCLTFYGPRTVACQAPPSSTLSRKRVSTESVMLSSHLIPYHPLLLLYFNFSQHQILFERVCSSHQVGQNIGASALASVLPVNSQGWLPVELTSLISLQSKGLSKIFSTPQFKTINSLVLSLFYGPTLTSIHDY